MCNFATEEFYWTRTRFIRIQFSFSSLNQIIELPVNPKLVLNHSSSLSQEKNWSPMKFFYWRAQKNMRQNDSVFSILTAAENDSHWHSNIEHFLTHLRGKALARGAKAFWLERHLWSKRTRDKIVQSLLTQIIWNDRQCCISTAVNKSWTTHLKLFLPTVSFARVSFFQF